MSEESQPPQHHGFPATIERCISRLQSLALSLDTYGDAADAAKLHEVIRDLKGAFPNPAFPFAGSMDFVVDGAFKVTRQQVANTLWHAFTGEISWLTITEAIPPRTIKFRSVDQVSLGSVDYPLNEGGVVRMVSTGAKPEMFELRLDVIARGLNVLANRYPRHFADLVNENGDLTTADVLLQCCVFGELIYG